MNRSCVRRRPPTTAATEVRTPSTRTPVAVPFLPSAASAKATTTATDAKTSNPIHASSRPVLSYAAYAPIRNRIAIAPRTAATTSNRHRRAAWNITDVTSRYATRCRSSWYAIPRRPTSIRSSSR